MNAARATILVVDDDPAGRALLTAALEDRDYSVTSAADGDAALASARHLHPAVIVADVLMPGIDGFELCRRVRADPCIASTPVILCSAAYLRDEDRAFALAAGASSYVTKDAQSTDAVLQEVAALEGGTARVRVPLSPEAFSTRHADVLSQQLTDKVHDLERANAELRQAVLATVNAMHRMLEYRDPYTLGHQRQVGELASAIGRRLGLDTHCIEGLLIGGYVHDIGKIDAPAEILSRPGQLTPLEAAIVREHAASGHEILSGLSFPWPVATMALQHHERLDGSGYPRGLRGDEITLEARIIAVADVVEAMTVHRPYRPSLGLDAALGEIRQGRGRLYDAAVADACIALFESGEFTFH